MACTFCNKTGSKLALHHLCEMCLVHLTCCEAAAEDDRTINSHRAVPGEDAIRKAECDICLEEYQEDELQEHRDTCIARLVFQCTVCTEEYISKEGMWNHLDIHEIADECKQLHFKEIRVTHKLHKCVLCNDQRGYQESHYWDHVHESHDGFFLRCSECGDCFRSQKLKTDHAANHCKAREQTVPLSADALVMDQNCIIDRPLPAETTAVVNCEVLNLQNMVDTREQNSIATYNEKDDMFIEFDSSQNSQFVENALENSLPSLNILDEADIDNFERDSGLSPGSSRCQVTAEENSQPLVEDSSSASSDTKCPHCDKCYQDKLDLIRHIVNCHEPSACDICGTISPGRSKSRYHKLIHHSEPTYQCPHCPTKLHLKSGYLRHLASHVQERKFACEICGTMFKNQHYVNMHMRRYHHVKRASTKAKGLLSDNEDSGEKSSTLMCPLDTRRENTSHKPESNTDIQVDSSNVPNNNPMSADQDHVELQFGKEPIESIGSSLNDADGSKITNEKSNESSTAALNFDPLKTTKCPDCDKVCHDASLLNRHIAFFHEQVECNVCGISITSRSRLKHHKLINHSEPKYKCPHCPAKIYLKKRFQNHLVSHVQERKFACEICGNKFKNLHYVSLHMSRTHHVRGAWKKVNASFSAYNKQQKFEQTESVATALKTTLRVPDDKGGEPSTEIMHHELVVCIICGMSFASNDQLKDHKVTCFLQTNEISPPNQEITPKMDADFHLSNVSSNSLSFCPSSKVLAPTDEIKIEETSLSLVENSSSESTTLAGAPSTTSKIQLTAGKIAHSLVENPSSEMTCPHCSKQFHGKIDLTRHIEASHEPTICDICGTTSLGRAQNRYHKLKYHKEPMYKCSQCPKTYLTPQSYRCHMASHVKERKFPCEICGLKFKNLDYVSMHLSRFHHVKGAWKRVKASHKANTEQEQQQEV